MNYSLATGTDYPLEGPNLALADLNGDGNLDLVIAQYNAMSIAVSLGKGDGTFGPSATYPLAGYPVQPVVVDVNRDGKLDIAVVDAAYRTTAIRVLPGNGDGTFQPAVNYPQQQSSQFLFQGDFNGDGLPDLITACQCGPWAVFLNEESATVTLPSVELPPSGTSAVYASYTGDENYKPSTSCDISPGIKPQSPVLTGIYSSHISSSAVSIGWTSNFPTNGYVSYGTTGPFGQSSPFEHKPADFHFVTLRGLAPATTYYYSVTSIGYFAGCDHWTTTSQPQSFTTPAQ